MHVCFPNGSDQGRAKYRIWSGVLVVCVWPCPAWSNKLHKRRPNTQVSCRLMRLQLSLGTDDDFPRILGYLDTWRPGHLDIKPTQGQSDSPFSCSLLLFLPNSLLSRSLSWTRSGISWLFVLFWATLAAYHSLQRAVICLRRDENGWMVPRMRRTSRW